jgi:ABC-type Fe3+-hydroxamate transport system substrate-binding protein
MLGAIGSSPYTGPASSGASAASLQAQLDRYQKQLSDCANCATAKTPQGQAAIQDLSGKIAAVKARIEQAATAKSGTPAPGANATAGGLLNVFA